MFPLHTKLPSKEIFETIELLKLSNPVKHGIYGPKTLKIYYLIPTFQGKINFPIQRVSRTIKLSKLMTKTTSRLLQLMSLCSASTLVRFLFFSHNYDFLTKKVIKVVRFSEKIMFFGHFRCFNAYFISVIIFHLFFIASSSSPNSVCFMLSCNKCCYVLRKLRV